MSRLRPAVVTVGDELILGELQNANNQEWMFQLFQHHHCPAEIGLTLPDELKVIARWIRELKKRNYFPIFVSGGIGGTHDDCTREGIAKGLGVSLTRHEDCYQQLAKRYQERFNLERQRMAWLPEECALIPNPYGAPGFQARGVYGFPGFPKMLQAMAPACLEALLQQTPPPEWLQEEVSFDLSEGQISRVVEDFAQAWPKVRLGIYADAKSTSPRVTLRLRYLKTHPEALTAFHEMIRDFRDLKPEKKVL